MDVLRQGLCAPYPDGEIVYSVKTNSIPAILAAVLQAGFRLEVVSRRELDLARSVGATPRQILYNGPAKSLEDLLFCYENGVDVNVDSLDELELAASLASAAEPFRLGIRVAATLASGAVSRFGIEADDPATMQAIRRISDRGSIRIVGLHVHHSSRRDAPSYCDRLDLLFDAAQRLGIDPLEYLDLGGGMASVPPPSVAERLRYRVDTPAELAATIGRHALARLGTAGPKVILEPGIGVLAGAMNYVTSIVAVKQRRSHGPIAVCDGSLFDVNPLRSAIPPPCVLVPASVAPRAPGTVPLYGGTCMEIDQLGALDQVPRKGDLAVVTNVGAYSVALSPEFITRRAPMYAVDGGEVIAR
jgi:diaminopimelate decarboxylase